MAANGKGKIENDPSVPIKNHRHELYAQAMVAGRNNTDGLRLAGYKAYAQNASRLRKIDTVRERISFLQADMAMKLAEATQTALTYDVPDVAELARTYTRVAISTLAEIAQDADSPTSSRVSAASVLLDRGWGKPLQSVAMAVGGAGELAKLLAEIDGASRGLPADPKLIDVTPQPPAPPPPPRERTAADDMH